MSKEEFICNIEICCSAAREEPRNGTRRKGAKAQRRIAIWVALRRKGAKEQGVHGSKGTLHRRKGTLQFDLRKSAKAHILYEWGMQGSAVCGQRAQI